MLEKKVGANNLKYCSYADSATMTNIIIGGEANAGTRLLLSNQAESATPVPLRADTVTEIVFKYLDCASFAVDVQAVSSKRFETDLLLAICALINPANMTDRELLHDIASAGQFDKYKNRDCARVSFAIAAWKNPKCSPLNQTVFNLEADEVANVLYEELIPRLPRLIEKIDYLEKFWLKDDSLLESSEEALRRGEFRIVEYTDIDLALVSMPDANSPPSASIHKMAVHNLTNCSRVLLMQEKNYEFYYRRESSPEFHSTATAPRIDLCVLADLLTKQESMDGIWKYSGNDQPVATMYLTGAPASIIEAEAFQEQILQFFVEHINAG